MWTPPAVQAGFAAGASGSTDIIDQVNGPADLIGESTFDRDPVPQSTIFQQHFMAFPRSSYVTRVSLAPSQMHTYGLQ